MKVVKVVYLNDVFPDGLMGEGIFYALNEYDVPWKNSISSLALDLEYYGNVSGGKTISPLLRRMLVDGVVPPSSVSRLANSLYSMNALRWRKLWDTYELEYNPIQNYDMTEIMSDDETVTEYGKSRTRTDNLSTTRTDNLSHGKTGTESDSRDLEDNTDNDIYGFNSSNASPADKIDKTVSEDTTRTFNTTETDTGTETTAHAGTQTEADDGSDTQTRNYTLTRSGNIGVTTSQQMIESERALWMWRYFYDVVFPDVDNMLTIPVYSDDIIPITVSGGIIPTGEISITVNGDYDVTEYASASVDVPNTYSESDNGMVVYNGELVSQIGREVSANGTYDTTLNNAVVVTVPNTYTAADEGKVVDNGALVAQGSQTITENGTYNTTRISELIANIPIGVTVLGGTTDPTSAEGSNGDIYIKYKDNTLPVGYTPVEYVENSVTGVYVNTGYLFKADSRIDIDVNVSGGGTYPTPFGCRTATTGSGTNQWYFSISGSTVYYAMGGSERSTGSSWVSDSDIHISAKAGEAVMSGGVEKIIYTNGQSGVGTIPLYLFAANLNDTPWSSSWAIMKLYRCQIFEGNTRIMDFVPAKRDSDDVLGLYERVNDVFYTNDGIGSFTAGAEGSTPIDRAYLKVNGSWIFLEDGNWDDINT